MRSRFIVFSALVHVVIFVAFLLKTLNDKTPVPLTAIEIEVTDQIPSSATESALTQNQMKKKTRSRKPGPLQLFPSYTTVLKKVLNRPVDHFSDESASGDYPEFDSAGGLSTQQLGFVSSLWNEVDKAIVNSPYLSEYGHTGKVFLKFEVTPDGKIADSTLRVDAQDPVLKVIALRAVRKALRNDKRELRLPPKNMKLTAQFAWANYDTCRRSKGTYRNSLSFCSYAENNLRNFTKKEKALTYLNALAYGFGALEEIEKYNREEMHSQNKFDPFEEYRRDPDWTTGT